MSDFRSGYFDRDRAPGVLRHLCPVQAVDSILEIDLQDLYSSGKKLLLLDMDNTLTEWRSEEIPETTHAWIKQAKDLGFDLCILSNTRNPDRLSRLATLLEVDFKFGKFKPSRHMFLEALRERKCEPDDALMIGDQMFTDVLGANRSGIDAILVRQMAPKEFVGTKFISRTGEKILRGRINRALVPDENLVGGAAAVAMLSDPVVMQFVKFCAVGASSTVIDVGLHYILMFVVPYQGHTFSEHIGKQLIEQGPSIFATLADGPEGFNPALAAQPVFKVFTAGIAIFNAFIWNRMWTFRISGKHEVGSQLRKFFTIAIIGAILNSSLVGFMSSIIPGHPKRSWLLATAIATVVVAFWNFFGQKYWTFKSTGQVPASPEENT
ncbi:MAG: YqeG family HAD IIIA-type phosphatase [Fimbriimonadaceae bacterium]